MKHSDCTISIICFNAIDACKRTLSAVLDSREGATLILTANGNPEVAEYFDKIASQRDNIKVLKNATNQGFVQPSNWAFSLCETPLFVALNDDALPPTNWLDKLKEAIAPEKVLIAGPDERWLDHNFVGHQWRGGMPMEPDFIQGSCMMVKADALKEAGLFLFWPELRVAYAEDAELCLRVRSLGYAIARADFDIIHKAGTTTRTVPELHDAMRENFGKCVEKWGAYLKTRKFT